MHLAVTLGLWAALAVPTESPSGTGIAGTAGSTSEAGQLAEDQLNELDRASRMVVLDGIWLFHDGDSPHFANPLTDDRDWQPAKVPTNTAHIPPHWRGTGWYRRHLQVGRWAVGERQLLSLGHAGAVAEVYVNGVLLAERGTFGSRMRGATRVTPLLAVVPEGLLVNGDNVIAVRLYESTFSGGLPTGPLLLGPPNEVRAQVLLRGQMILLLRLALAVVAITLALGQLFVPPRSLWLLGAGLALAVVHSEGTGLLEALLPNLELALRLPKVAMALAMLCLASYFAGRFDTLHNSRLRLMQAGLTIWSGLVLLVSEEVVAFIASPVQLLWALTLTLYGGHLLAQAARRQERGTLPLFAALVLLVALLMRDALFPGSDVWLGSWSAGGAVGLLVLACVSAASSSIQEHTRVLTTMLRLQRQADERVWLDVLSATASAIDRPHTFLDAVAHEISRQLESRRCSVLLPDSQSNLFIAACHGLPRQAWRRAVPPGKGIANQAFAGAEVITSTSVLPDLLHRNASSHPSHNYTTDSFVAQPILADGQVLGVLNVSDRNDGGEYSAAQKAQLAHMGGQLGKVLRVLRVDLEGTVAEVTGLHARPDSGADAGQLGPTTAPADGLSTVSPVPVDSGDGHDRSAGPSPAGDDTTSAWPPSTRRPPGPP